MNRVGRIAAWGLIGLLVVAILGLYIWMALEPQNFGMQVSGSATGSIHHSPFAGLQGSVQVR